jgi:hypothetical protein
MKQAWGGLVNPVRRGVQVALFLGLGVVLVAATASAQKPPATQTPPPRPQPQPQPAAGSPMDQPLQLLAQARQAYQGVRDYTCLFIKREQVNGQMQPENVMAMKVRIQPFSVYFRWHAPKTLAGQELAYVAGRNAGMMRIHPTGVFGALGFLSLQLNDPRAMQTNRHTVADAGIGSLIEQLTQHWDVAKRTGQMQVRLGEYEYNHRRCLRVETQYRNRNVGQVYACRSVVYFDKENHLPIRIETYDWPKAGGPPQGELLESYSYVDLRLNPGLDDTAFNY